VFEGTSESTRESTVANSSTATAGNYSSYCDDSSETPAYTPEGIRKSTRAEGEQVGLFKAVARGKEQAAKDNEDN
jgi:hypothetical protein